MASKKAKLAALKRVAKKFDEQAHTRIPAGQPGGGQFTSHSSGGALPDLTDLAQRAAIMKKAREKRARRKGIPVEASGQKQAVELAKPQTTGGRLSEMEKKVQPVTSTQSSDPVKQKQRDRQVIEKWKAKQSQPPEVQPPQPVPVSEANRQKYAAFRAQQQEKPVQPFRETPKNPSPKAPEFASHKEAEQWLSKQIPHINFELKGIHPKLLQGAADTLVARAREFPKVAETLRNIITGKGSTPLPAQFDDMERWHQGYMSAAAAPSINLLALNPGFFKSEAVRQYNEKQKELAETGQNFNVYRDHDSNYLSKVIDHEFGHFVDDYFRKKAKVNPNIERIAASLFDSTEPEDLDKVSGYAKANDREAFAEGFAQARGQNPKKHGTYTKRQTVALDLMKRIDDGEEIPRAAVYRKLLDTGIHPGYLAPHF